MVTVTTLSSVAAFHISIVNTHHKQEPKIGHFNKVLHKRDTYALIYYFYIQMQFYALSVNTQNITHCCKIKISFTFN